MEETFASYMLRSGIEEVVKNIAGISRHMNFIPDRIAVSGDGCHLLGWFGTNGKYAEMEISPGAHISLATCFETGTPSSRTVVYATDVPTVYCPAIVSAIKEMDEFLQ